MKPMRGTLHYMKKALRFLIFFGVVAITVSATVSPTLAVKPLHSGHNGGGSGGSAMSQTGNDVSWPQCGKALPKGQLFGIVGVNGGLANNSNQCFSSELAWANGSTGGSGQSKAALYVNTANPGNLHVADWPQNGINVYGTCTGEDDQACAYQYGWNLAEADASTRIGANIPATFKWWLDVETENSWEKNTANNVADLEGVTDYFQGIGASVGLYSTATQWSQITAKSVTPISSLNGLDSWIPGAKSLSSAKANCSLHALTSDGKVTVTQYVSKQTDYDYSCI
jgi:hypothetical protein